MKNKEELEQENPFADFKESFLGQPIPKEIVKETKKPESKSNQNEDLSEDEIENLENVAKKQAESKKPAKEVEEIKEPVNNEEPETELNLFIEFARQLNDEGILSLKDDDKIETEEDLFNVVKREKQNAVDSYKNSKPEDVQKFLEFVDNGGNPSDFHKYYYSDGSFEDFNIDNEDNQKYVIEQDLRIQGYTDEEIEEEINDASDLGKLEKKANTSLKKLQKLESDNKKMLVEAQKAYAARQEAEREEQWNAFKKGLFDKDEIGGFKFSPKMKNDTWDYMTKPISRKDPRTQYQIDMDENPDARYIYAYLLKNKWNVETLANQVQTKGNTRTEKEIRLFDATEKI